MSPKAESAKMVLVISQVVLDFSPALPFEKETCHSWKLGMVLFKLQSSNVLTEKWLS